MISIKKNIKDILIPSEERKITMFPMDYEEFLWAIGDKSTTKLLAEVFEKRISLLFDAIPAQLNTNASRYQVSSVLEGERAEQILELIADMADSKTIHVAYHANDPNVGLANAKDLRRFKLFMADTGLIIGCFFGEIF